LTPIAIGPAAAGVNRRYLTSFCPAVPLAEKLRDRVYHVLLRLARNFGINR